MDPVETAHLPSAVLDTNVVLDWLLFDDTYGREVGRAVVARELIWVATTAMRDELFEVLNRETLADWRPDPVAARRTWDTHCRPCPTPPTSVGTARSADPDDQMFVDLALSAGAVWLLSRDRALLDLAQVLRPRGVHVMTPATWAASRRGGTT